MMDCNAGGAIGQSFLHSMGQGGGGMMRGYGDMMHHGGAGDEDQLMDGAMAPSAEWASDFQHQQQHIPPHVMAQHQQQAHQHMADEMEAMMMEEAYNEQQQQQQQQQQGVAGEDAAYQDAFHGDDWLGQYDAAQTEGEQWAQDYNDEDVQVYTVEGEPLKTVEEKTRDSQFYGLLEKIRTREVVIDEERGEIVAGPANVPTSWEEDFVAAQSQALQEDGDDWAEQQQQGDAAVDMEQAWNTNETAEDAAFRAAWGSDEPDEDYAERLFAGDHMEDTGEEWLNEYQNMQNDFKNAQESTDYPFEANNPYLFHDDPFSEGVALQQAGNVAEAVLAFEAACQKDVSGQVAWRSLGTAQAENEKDILAIRALNKARELNPRDIEVHGALAVSHTNESNHAQALRALRDWLLSQPAYESLGSISLNNDVSEAAEEDMVNQFLFVSPSEHRDCYTLFQAAIQLNPSDADLHSSLGVLKNLSHEYDEAAIHFNEAIAHRPDDPKLWNKLGATLANGNRSREALAAYDRALDLNPGYVRAQYNLGIAHSNLGEHAVAGKQLLRAIVMQQGGVSSAENGSGTGRSTREMWDVLRMTLNLMDRSDLVDLTWKQDVVPFLPEFGLEELL